MARRAGSAERDDALLGPLAEHAQRRALEVDVIAVQTGQLRDADRGAVERFEHRVIAQLHGVARRRALGESVEHSAHTFRGGHARKRAAALGRDEPQARVVRHQAFLGGPPEESPGSRSAPGECRTRISALGRAPQPLAQRLQIDVGQLSPGDGRGQIVQIRPVRADRRGREPPHARELLRVRGGRSVEVHPPSMPAPRVLASAAHGRSRHGHAVARRGATPPHRA